jgi:hypothetical protein
MTSRYSNKEYGLFTQILRQGVALALCTTLLPFTQLDLLAQNAPPPQQSQYPYQDPGDNSQQQAPPPQYGQQGQSPDGNGPAGPPPAYGQGGYGQGEQGAPPSGEAPGPAYEPQGPQQLQQLVAPIALYPDSLVAQVLAASTYPQQVQEAESWMQQYGNQPPEQLAQAVNGMPWDPSVKALTAFPSVLLQLARSGQWTIDLGNAYYNQPADVMAAVQSMRYRAREAGQLRDTPQQIVVDQGPEIIIQPANPDVVYVPYYDPWVVYGAPIPAYYGFYRPPPPYGLALGIGIGIGFGIGIGIGVFGHYGWGYHSWAPNWRSNTIIVNNNTYISRSTTVYNRGGYGAFNQGFGRGGPQGFAHASFNARAPLYRGAPISTVNRPPAAPAGGFNRPGGQPGAFNRPAGNGSGGQPGGFNRPATAPANTNGFNRPATGANGYNRPATGAGGYTGGYNRPAANANGYNRPAAGSANGGYNRPAAPSANYSRPAPGGGYNGGSRPQAQAAPRPSNGGGSHPAPRAQSHPSGGGEHHGNGGGEHHDKK